MQYINSYKKITNYLNKCIDNDCLSHAYIFYGPDNLSKKYIALEFAKLVLNNDAKFHPDLMIVSADAEEDRSINAIRQLKKFLILSPCSGKYKIAIIEEAEKLNVYAQNALLKIFEEAPHRSIVILCAKTIDSISETIASRGVKLPFWHQNNSELALDEKTAKIFNGILDDSFNNYPNCLIEKFGDTKAIEIFAMWLKFLREKFLANPDKKLYEILKASQYICFKLNETNINPKLACDELALNLWRF